MFFVKLFDSFYCCRIAEGMNDEEIKMHISGAVKLKKKALGGNDNSDQIVGQKNRPMILIGG